MMMIMIMIIPWGEGEKEIESLMFSIPCRFSSNVLRDRTIGTENASTYPSTHVSTHPVVVVVLWYLSLACALHHVSHLLYAQFVSQMSFSFLHLQGLLNGSLESRGVGTDNLTDLVAVLEEQESRHGANGQLLRDLWELIDVDFVEFGGGEFVCESVDERRGG